MTPAWLWVRRPTTAPAPKSQPREIVGFRTMPRAPEVERLDMAVRRA